MADHNLPGTHWVALFIRNNIAIYFDSYGLAPPNDIKEFTKKNKLIYSSDMIQSMTSTACGFYCIYFLFFFNKLDTQYSTDKKYGYALNKLLLKFDKNNSEKNDDILRREIKKIFTIVRK
jgi:hypothetical protein